jgi:hypothetical protein
MMAYIIDILRCIGQKYDTNAMSDGSGREFGEE